MMYTVDFLVLPENRSVKYLAFSTEVLIGSPNFLQFALPSQLPTQQPDDIVTISEEGHIILVGSKCCSGRSSFTVDQYARTSTGLDLICEGGEGLDHQGSAQDD